MDNRLYYPHQIRKELYSQQKPRRSGQTIRGTSTDMDWTSPASGTFDEKELMQGLNDRLAGFIGKVHQLEYQNHLLEREIEDIRGKTKPASCFEEEYEPELRKLRMLVQDITHQKHQIDIEHQNLEEELSSLRKQHEQEARSRLDAESKTMLLKKDVNDAYQAKLHLDKKVQSLVDEIHFLKRDHKTQMSELFDQIQEEEITVKENKFEHPGVTAVLRDIRAQLEGHTVSDVQQVGETFRSQFARLTEAAETKRQALKATQQEIQQYRKRLQGKKIELDCAKGTREALEKQLHDVEDRHKEEILHYQNTIKELENELINCKFDMSGYLREYQDLLNVKMALDVEIMSYRKLLCGEETRLSSMSDTHISLPYIYHQSPIYTLPRHSRPGGPHRRVEPHYKFVEEIVTETTREIEMSEFEDTGSEGTEEENNEQDCTKRERGSSEEENNSKDIREKEGDQISESRQNQVALVVISVNGIGEKGEESAGQADDGKKGQKSKEESGETEAADNEVDSVIDKVTQREVSLGESFVVEKNTHHKKAENKEEKEASVIMVNIQTDLSAKLQDLEFPVEGKAHIQGYEEDSSISALAEKSGGETSVHESEQSEKTQELSSVAQVQDKVSTSVSETAEKTTDFTAQSTSSTTLASEGKTNSDKEAKQNNKSDAEEGQDEVAKSTQSSCHDSNKNQEKGSSLKSIVKSLPDVEGQQPNTWDKTETVQSELAKEKTASTVEINAFHQEAPERNQAQKPKGSSNSEKK